jgi:hypothetical protein
LKKGLDSAYPPSKAQIAAARAAGYDAWLGYFAGPNILNGWSDQDFIAVYQGGLETGAYCSGWADPLQMKARADHLTATIPGFVGMLDDESGIRSVVKFNLAATRRYSNRTLARSIMHNVNGATRPVLERQLDGTYKVSAWVQPWLNASGFGQYGNQPVFAGVHASRYVFAAYPGMDPGASWPSYYPRPGDGHPCGWQFEGTHDFAGIGVDSTHFDDNFWVFGPSPHDVTEDDMLYIGPYKPLTTTFKTFAPAVVYSDPSSSALQVGGLGVGASVAVVGYLFSNSGVLSSDRGAGAGPGIDYVWWRTSSGTYVSDADLLTTGVAGLPEGTALSTLPSGMKLYLAKESELANLSGGISLQQVNDAITAALAKLPLSGLTKEQVDQEILTALGNLPVPASVAHHHGVLGIINTGPVIPDKL